jgi:hypothetical protein
MAHDTPRRKGDISMRKFALLAALAGLVSAVLKKQRDRELDEAIWEEPRDL